MKADDQIMEDMPNDVDLSTGVRSHFAGRLSRTMQFVVIEPGVVQAFPSSDRVNTALRKVVQVCSAENTNPRRKAS